MIRFVIWSAFADSPYLNWLARIMGVISISSTSGPRALAKALRTARDGLRSGDLICIFAEGEISRTGNMLRFKRGFEKIIKGVDAPIIPAYLDRVWGSVFSYQGRKAILKWPKRFPYPITVGFGDPLPPTTAAEDLRQVVQELGSECVEERKVMEKPVHRIFVRAANRHCYRFFIADSSGKELSFGKTLAGTIALTRVIKRTIPRDEKMVGILLPPSVAGSVVNYALLCAGHVPVNLNYTASPESMASSIEQCGIKTIISTPLFLKRLKLELPFEATAIESLMKQVSGLDKMIGALGSFVLPGWITENVLLGLSSSKMDDLLTVIFSSGSTGEPKGVMLTHHNVVSNARSVIDVIDPNSMDRLVGVLPLFHSFGFLANLWVPAMVPCGAAFHFNPLDCKTIGDLAEKYDGSILLATPTFLRHYIRRISPEQFKALRFVIVGAEKLPMQLGKEFHEKFGVEPLEGYGATELSPVASINVPDFVTQDGRQIGNKAGTVGHPIPGVSAKVVNPDTDADVTQGEEGLLLIKGPNVMKGYLGHPEQTEKVIKDGWYVTGDMAKIDEDGFITITDRLSRFSKIGGEMVPHIRVEESVEQAVRDLCADNGAEVPDSSERIAAVTSVPDESKGERLVVLHIQFSAEIQPVHVWEKLRALGLPNLWVPSKTAFHLVESFPVLGTGKLDLRQVKAIALKREGLAD